MHSIITVFGLRFVGNDKADTLLGNLAAGNQDAIENASTSIDFAIVITATQID